MPPVQVHTKSPINAAKASGVTPQTAAPGVAGADVSGDATTTPTTTTTTTTAAAAASSAFHPSSNPPPTRTIPSLQQQPAPPQPGAVPRLPEATGAPAPPRNATGDSPGAGGPAPRPAPTAAPILGVSYPPQMGRPPPQAGHNQRGTTAAPLGGGAYPGPGPGPGGYYYYQQNGSSASSSSAAAAGYVPPYQGGGGGGSRGTGEEEEEGGFFGSALKLAKAAGEKLSAAESEVWRRINGEGN
ncbi:hypothetical protein L209DRAFT_751860 [Thermothelomyces heterothallicus CBS 203.75]